MFLVKSIFSKRKMSNCVGCAGNVTGQNIPCTGRVCLGKCSGPCPAGYHCQKNNFGVYRCVKAPPEIWQQWWFWVILILGVLIVIGIIYLIYRSAAAKYVKTPAAVPGVQLPKAPPPPIPQQPIANPAYTAYAANPASKAPYGIPGLS